MSWKRHRALIASDLYRHTGKLSRGLFWKHLLWTPGFRYTVLLRLYSYARGAGWCRLGPRQAIVLLLHHYSIRYGIEISRDVAIGSGFYIGHFGGIVVNQSARIGRNCNLSQGVTIGQANRGANAGCPIIGDNVYIGPGAKLVGRVQIGDNAAIGANAVVVKDVPPGVSVGGVPAQVISENGSQGYVNRTDYPPVPAE